MSKLPASTWIIIPAYNEQKYLDTVLKKANEHSNNIVVVDDGSTDDTSKIAQQHNVRLLVHRVNLGKGAALKTGCDYAFGKLSAKHVIIMDSDDQHDPSELPLFQTALKKHDMVLGVRDLSKMPLFRQFANKYLTFVILLFFGKNIPDILSGYKAFSKNIYNKIRWDSAAYGVELEIAISIAQNNIPHTIQPIKTIYHDLSRGMTLLDGLSIIGHVLSRKVGI